MVTSERMQASGTSERQLADGLTKVAARQLHDDRVRSGKVLLIHHPTFKASKENAAVERLSSTKAASDAKILLDQEARDLANRQDKMTQWKHCKTYRISPKTLSLKPPTRKLPQIAFLNTEATIATSAAATDARDT